jgi:hypothetical protein
LGVEIPEPWIAQDKLNSAESGDVEAFFDLFIGAAHHQINVVRDFASGVKGPVNISEFDGVL